MLRLYNTLTGKVEDFRPIRPPEVGMYTCGPTVYDFAHIGNFRTYTMADVLVRTLTYNGLSVKYIMNITDVGHLTGDNLGDADTGEDRVEKKAQIEGKSAWDIAKFYTRAFTEDFKKLNLTAPYLLVKATDHIEEQIALVEKLEEKGFTYPTSDGIYFDTDKFTGYGAFSPLDEIKEGARVAVNFEKRNPRDFALWKFSPQGAKRQMEWESPWGVGFPGWHIECSAMSMEYLGGEPFGSELRAELQGRTIDIHAGGSDLAATHHPNEIAQSEAATGKQFVKYWMHVAFMLIDGARMSKSLGNNYTVSDVERRDFDPLALRYLYFQTHYRKELNFTFEALAGAQTALKRLREEISQWSEPKIGCAEFEEKFLSAINDDLNLPKALAVVWDLVKSDYPTSAKAESLFKFDQVLGLNLNQKLGATLRLRSGQGSKKLEVPAEVMELVKEREELRKKKRFHLADDIRAKISKLGYELLDSGKETIIKKA